MSQNKRVLAATVERINFDICSLIDAWILQTIGVLQDEVLETDRIETHFTSTHLCDCDVVDGVNEYCESFGSGGVRHDHKDRDVGECCRTKCYIFKSFV
jgi:hypothetical protein